MSTFLFIVGAIVWFVAICGILLGGGFFTLELFADGYPKQGSAVGVGSILALALVICIPIWAGVFDEDNSQHCGPGTVYRESSQYNPATESTDYSWWCEAR
ncbi:hypothetical protein [Rhodococcus sp. UNC363MFTsu5.1]|uniref:hypothetical protein n=1 Tax=Rhodococcus sp. UNC363MFTsu5.1 TaxID=1449069 RepID=UPI00048899E0|nr:hypothetical protein [Rhodococcus sp. UNC363MFTsu5.1]